MLTDTASATHPPGFWTRETLITGPMVPMFASVWCEPCTRGFADAFARWGYLGDGVVVAVLDGWLYGSFRPLSDPGLVPVRIARAQAAADGDEHLEAARDWLQVAGPGFERRRRRLDGEPVGTDACADRLEDAARLMRDLVRSRFTVIPGAQEVVVEWVLHAGERLGWSADRALALVTDPGGRAPHLDALVAAASAVPALRTRIEAGEVPALAEMAAEPSVADALAGILDTDGDLLLLTDITAPTLAERPEHLAAAVAAAVVAADRPGPATATTDDERDLDPAAARALARAREAHPVRDASGDLLLRGVGTLRRIALAGGRALGLPDPGDALLLTAEELAALLRRGATAAADTELIAARRDAYDRAVDDPPPPVLGTPPEPPPPPAGLPPAAARAMQRMAALVQLRGAADGGAPLTGTPGSAGTHIGVARVVLRVEDAVAVRPGEVLVCPVTAPAWNLAMARSGAVVCDSGGQLSHAAITAREFGVPAVVGCRDATATIRTGERVLVDGAAGTVRRL